MLLPGATIVVGPLQKRSTVMGNPKVGKTDHEHLRAFWEAWRSIEEDNLVIIEMSAHPTDRSGVVCWHITATDPMSRVLGLDPIASIRMEYPNSNNGTLEAFLFNQALKLGAMLDQRAKELRKRPEHN
jgi:hypothetical protein